MNKAIFLDRDGTINVDYGYVSEISKFVFVDGAVEGLKILNDLGYLLIVISNQSGIGRNYYSEAKLLELNNYMIKELKKKGITINGIYYCPHVDSDNCDCRKPKLKLFYDAIRDFDIDINNSYAIGDKERDLAICDRENVVGILLTSEKNDKYMCKNNLLDASKYIKKRSKNNE